MSKLQRFFADRTGKGVRIAVVDSGVHAAHPHVGTIAGGIAISEAGAEHHDYVDRLGHGTAITAAIREKAPGAEIYAVKVFERSLTTRVERLIQAMDWAGKNDMHLLNLSLGTTKPEYAAALQDAVDRARAAGVTIVAAREDGELRWLPGSLRGVLPVILDWQCPREEYRVTRSSEGAALFCASGYPRPIPGVSPDRNLKGISFAVANMTGFAARALEEFRNIIET